jgi:hypothetical protein
VEIKRGKGCLKIQNPLTAEDAKNLCKVRKKFVGVENFQPLLGVLCAAFSNFAVKVF